MTWPGSTSPAGGRARRRRRSKARETARQHRLYVESGGTLGVRPNAPTHFETLTLDDAAARVGFVPDAIGMPPDALYDFVLRKWLAQNARAKGKSPRIVRLGGLAGARGAVAIYTGKPGDAFLFRFSKPKQEKPASTEAELLGRHRRDLTKLVEYLLSVQQGVHEFPSGSSTCGRCGRDLRDKKRCGACGWFRLPPAPLTEGDFTDACDVEASPTTRIVTGLPWADAVWGGGVVTSSVTLIAGRPGSGKTSALLQIASRLAQQRRRKVFFLNVEMVGAELQDCAVRIGVGPGEILLCRNFAKLRPGDDLVEFAASLPGALILDSVSSLVGKTLHAAVEVCKALKAYAAAYEVPVFMVAHVIKEGATGGAMGLQHQADACLRLDLRDDGRRTLVAEKNRFGPTHRPVHLVMTPHGLAGVPSDT